ncbi:uncharacterized protein LOC113313877 isoform X2 [Papaver somniferum]|uniref:uncharacterized protein LOC113313877 isoform X2 n=1 Tax=Papaver somniferum TaxID=3469 RepID=UPI000E6FB3DB|nr:uncharacterized protein LOC113313877 isoform X2 [Papaver somniferum]
MMNTGFVDNAFRPLDLGNFPPWHITVTVAGGETRHINIPYPMTNNVIGLPLSLGVPEGMRDLITGIVRDLAQCQQDAAHFREDAARFRQDAIRFKQDAARCLQDANRYYCELEKLKFRMGGKVVVSKVLMSPVSSSKKRKLGTEESGLSETQEVCIEKPEHLPPPKSKDWPSIQESVIEKNMVESDEVPRREDVQTEKVEFVAGVVPIRESVDASTICTSANCLNVDSWSTLSNLNSIDVTPSLVASTIVSGQGEDEGFEYAENLKSDDLPLTSVKHSQGENVPTYVHTEQVASVAGVMLVEEPVDATMISTSVNCLTADCTTLTISTPICTAPTLIESTSVSSRVGDEWHEDVENLKLDALPLASVKRSRSEDVPTSASLICSDVRTEQVASVAGALVVWEPVDATMTSTSANCQTGNFTALTISTPADNTLPLIVPTSVSSRVGDEWFENVDNFRIPKVYADLYKKIFSKHGHMATKKVIRSNDDILLAAVTSLMKIVSRMETIRGVDLSVKLIESWEGHIGDAETLQFNIKWLREIFTKLKNSWKSSFKIDKEVEIREQVLDATQVEYAGLRSRKDELETELLEVTMKIREFEGKISSEREAIQVKMAEKNIFLFKPVLGNLFNLEITN